MEAYKEDTKPLLRPHQVQDMKEEAQRLEASLQAPPHIAAAIQAPGEIRKQLQNVRHALETQAPKPYSPEEKDASIKRERELREAMVSDGMLTQAELRRNPAGAVDKLRRWESRNKIRLAEWKNIRLRQHESGMLDELADAKDVANFERHRPAEASHELNMHNEQIPGKMQYGPEPGAGPSTVLTDNDKAVLQTLDPELAEQIALLSNAQRAEVKAIIQKVVTPTEQTVQYHEDYQEIRNPPKGGKWTPEKRKAMSERKKKEWAERKAKKA